MKKTIYILLALLLLTLAACSNNSQEKENNNAANNDAENTSASEKGSKTASIVMWSSPDTFNPYFSQGNYGKYAGGELAIETLLGYDPEYNFIPKLAESYDVSDDGLEYTFELQEDAVWHNGEPFTAEDVAFTFQSIMDPDWTGTGFVELSKVVGAKDYKDGKADEVPGIEIVDDHTIKFELKEPYAPFLEAVGKGLWILPKHEFEGVEISDISKAEFSKNPVGTGPIKFAKYAVDQYVEYEANKDYYLGELNFDKLILRIMTPDIALGAFEAGELDATTRAGIGTINVSDFDAVQKIENLDVTVFDTMDYQEMTVNTQQPYLSDKKIRQALMYAVDRQTLVDQLLQGKGKVANGPIAEDSPWYNTDMETYDYNPEKAKELLEEAGWDFNQEITLSVPKGNLTREKSAPIIQQMLSEIDLKVSLEFMDFATLMDLMEKQELDLALLGTSTGKIDPDSNIYTFYHSEQLRPAGWNTTGYADDNMDKLLDEGATETDEDKRKEIYDEIQSQLSEDLPSIFLYYEQAIGATNKRLKNAEPNQIGIDWNMLDWELTD